MRDIYSFIKKYDIALILCGAFLIRLFSLRFLAASDFPEVYRDYFMVSSLAEGRMVWAGPPSMLGGYHFGPLYYYLLVPFFILGFGHPASLFFSGIIISVASIYGLFRLVLLWTGNRNAALVAAILASCSVYSIHLTSFTSNPNFLPLFVLLYFYFLTHIAQKKVSASNFLWLGVSFGLASQLHATATLILPLVALTTLLLCKVYGTFKLWAYAFVAFLIVNIPYIVFESYSGFKNILRLFHLGNTYLQAGNAKNGLWAFWNFFEGTLSPFNLYYSFTNIEPRWLYVLVALLGLWFIIVLSYSFFVKKEQKKIITKVPWVALVIVSAWFLSTLLMIVLYSKGLHLHYFIILWPLPLIVLTYAVIWCKEKYGIKYSLISLLLVSSLLQVFSYYTRPTQEWGVFLRRFTVYKTMPNISEIGAGGAEPYVLLPEE